MQKEKKFVGVKELARILNERLGTIYHWVQQRKIPHFRRGRLLQFDLEEIEKWDKENNYRPVTDYEDDAEDEEEE